MSQKQVDMLNEYIKALEKQLSSFETERQSLASHMEKTESSTLQYNTQNTALKNEVSSLKSQLYIERNDKRNAETRLKISNDANQVLKKQMEQREAIISNLNKKAAENSAQLTSLHTSLENLKLQNKQTQERQAELLKEKDIDQKTIVSIEQSNARYQKQVKSQHEQIKIQLSEIDFLKDKLRKLSDQISNLSKQNELLQADLIHQKSQHSATKKQLEANLLHSKESSSHQIALKNQEIHKLNQQLKSLKEKTERQFSDLSTSSQTTIQNMKRQSQNLRQSNDDLKQKVETLQKATSDLSRSQDSLKVLMEKQLSKQKAQMAESKNAALSQQKMLYETQSRQQSDKFNEKLKALQLQMEKIKNLNREETQKLSEELRSKESVVLNLKSQISKIKTEKEVQLNFVNKELDRAVKTADSLSTELNHEREVTVGVRNQLRISVAKNEDFKKTIASLTEQLSKFQKENLFAEKQLSNKTQEQGKQLSELKTRIGKQATKIQDLEREIEKKEQQSKETLERVLQAHKLETQQNRDQFQNQVHQARAQVALLEERMALENQKHQEKMEEALQEMKQKYLSQKKEMKDEEQTLKEKIRRLERQIKSHQQKVSAEKSSSEFVLQEKKDQKYLLEIRDKQRQIEKLEKQVARLKKQLDEAAVQSQEYSEQIDSLEESNRYLKMKVSDGIEEHEALRKEMVDLKYKKSRGNKESQALSIGDEDKLSSYKNLNESTRVQSIREKYAGSSRKSTASQRNLNFSKSIVIPSSVATDRYLNNNETRSELGKEK